MFPCNIINFKKKTLSVWGCVLIYQHNLIKNAFDNFFEGSVISSNKQLNTRET